MRACLHYGLAMRMCLGLPQLGRNWPDPDSLAGSDGLICKGFEGSFLLSLECFGKREREMCDGEDGEL